MADRLTVGVTDCMVPWQGIEYWLTELLLREGRGAFQS